MNRYAIQDRMILQWDGTQDNLEVKSALECARCYGYIDTISKPWRWLAEDLMILYSEKPNEAAACHSWCHGWISGASKIMGKALLSSRIFKK